MGKRVTLKVPKIQKRFNLSRPLTNLRLSDLTFDDLYQDISDNWQDRARRLQVRRWRKIKHQLP